jgi:Flp pilus assembly protein TadD
VAVDLAAGKPADARSRVEARLAKTPNDPAILILAARTYATTGDMAKAESALQKAIELAPDNLQAYMMLAQVYLSQRKLDQAKDRLEEMARRQPRPVGPETMIGMILEMQGKNAEAQKRYEKVLEIDPRAPVAANNLASVYAEAGVNLDMALQFAQVAKVALPDAPEVNDTLGWVYCKKDVGALAVPPLQAAVQNDPKNPMYHYHLGIAYAKSGEKAKAAASLDTALKLSPTFDGAPDAKKLLATLR